VTATEYASMAIRRARVWRERSEPTIEDPEFGEPQARPAISLPRRQPSSGPPWHLGSRAGPVGEVSGFRVQACHPCESLQEPENAGSSGQATTPHKWVLQETRVSQLDSKKGIGKIGNSMRHFAARPAG
jgi:hypothetical protein